MGPSAAAPAALAIVTPQTHTIETTVIHLLRFLGTAWLIKSSHCFMALCAHHVSEIITLCCAFCVLRLKGLQPQKPHGQLRRKPFCGFPLHLLIPLVASCLLCSMKDEMTANHRVRTGWLCPGEANNWSHLVIREVIQLFGSEGKDDPSLCGHSHLVSHSSVLDTGL